MIASDAVKKENGGEGMSAVHTSQMVTSPIDLSLLLHNEMHPFFLSTSTLLAVPTNVPTPPSCVPVNAST